MKVFLVTFGSHGDVHPIISIGRVLQEQGHQVLVFVQPYFCHDVEQAGLPVHPIAKEIDIEEFLKHPDNQYPRKAATRYRKVLFKVMPLIVRDLRFMVERERPDVIVSLLPCFGVQWVCEKFSVPHISVALAPSWWPSRHELISMELPLAQRIAERITYGLSVRLAALTAWMRNFQINRMRKAVGLSPEKTSNVLNNKETYLGLWSSAYRPPTLDEPANSQICGFPFYDGQSTIEENSTLWDFVESGTPPIVFTLGTTAVHLSSNFYTIAAQTCEQLGRRGVLLIGHSGKRPNNLPENIFTFSYIPLSELLPHACAVVHHGGIGCVAQSLRAGCPAVVVPHAYDQFDNAQRVTRLGVGVTVKRKGLTTKHLADALRYLLGNTTVAQHCKEISERVSKENGALVAAEIMLRIAKENRTIVA